MIAILERTQSNVQQNIEQLQTSTMGVTINKKSTTTKSLKVSFTLMYHMFNLEEVGDLENIKSIDYSFISQNHN